MTEFTRSASGLSRRAIFRTGGVAGAVSVLGGTPTAASATMAAAQTGGNIYTRIGVRPFINLTATFTINGGTLTLPEVKQAMEEASYHPVNIDELMEKEIGRAHV